MILIYVRERGSNTATPPGDPPNPDVGGTIQKFAIGPVVRRCVWVPTGVVGGPCVVAQAHRVRKDSGGIPPFSSWFRTKMRGNDTPGTACSFSHVSYSSSLCVSTLVYPLYVAIQHRTRL